MKGVTGLVNDIMKDEKEKVVKQAARFADAAFPVTVTFSYETEPNKNYVATSKGLSKRELFAAMAMQGFVLHYSGYVDCNFETDPIKTASRAVKYADALIAELEKNGTAT